MSAMISPGFDIQCSQDFVRFLIGVALGIFERTDICLRIVVQAVHLMFIAFDGVLSPEKSGRQNQRDE